MTSQISPLRPECCLELISGELRQAFRWDSKKAQLCKIPRRGYTKVGMQTV